MSNLVEKIKKSVRKNKSEAIALVTGRMPKFVYGIKNFKDIPVFCFHSAQYPLFENQLQFLNKNGYKTLTADELYERRIDKNYKNNGKEVALTFDDGMASVWTTAYPLLQKYEQKIISFILPGLLVDGEDIGVTIDDTENEQEKIELSKRDYTDNPLCNWQEIKKMHESGLVDFQSHGMHHALISISPKIVDFIHPGFDTYHYGNICIPLYCDTSGNDSRLEIPGHPVYEHVPRLSAKARYLDSTKLRKACASYVTKQGNEQFFTQENWRHKLKQFVADYQSKNNEKYNDYETAEQVYDAIKAELIDSREYIEKILNKNVKHFCFPWFVGSNISAEVLCKAGYLSAHMGELNGFSVKMNKNHPLLINRIQEEYLQALPGLRNNSLLQVFKSKRN